MKGSKKLFKNSVNTLTVTLLTTLINLSGCANQKNLKSTELMENKRIMSDAYEKVFNQNNPDELENIFSEEYVAHHPIAPFKGLEILKQQVTYANNALSGYNIDVHDIFSERNMVVSRFTVRGKHVAPFFNIPGTGKSLRITGMLFTRIEDNKIVEEWEYFDQIGILQQLDVIKSVRNSPIPALTRIKSQEFEWGKPLLTKVSPNTENCMQSNKSLIYKMVDNLWNKGKKSAFSTFFSNKFRIHAPNIPDIKNLNNFKNYWGKIQRSTMKFNISIDDIIAEGNIVAIRLATQCVLKTTKKQISTGGIAILKIVNSRIVECWLTADIIGLYKQLGILPAQ
ncbi:MAG: ester cyclase family protein [Spirochaetota bacterium]|nr:ester cyclase family protein [Spirochaetota bacterium]